MKALLIKKLHILLKALGLETEKDSIYSGYGVESSKDMTLEQLKELVTALERQADQPQQVKDDERKLLISNCLTIITGVKWIGYPNGAWDEINNLVRSNHIGMGKTLNQMNAEELKSCRKRLIMAHTNKLRYNNRHEYFAKLREPQQQRYETMLLKTNNIVS